MTEPSKISPKPASDESLSHLYHMSTTAGVGAQEYVAINIFAVLAVILGLASTLLLMGWDNLTLFFVLLVVPVAGIISALISLVQIRGSNGTQAGIGWASVGVLLALLLVGSVGWHHVQYQKVVQQEQKVIGALVTQFATDLQTKDYAAARGLFTAEFQHDWPLPKFTSQVTNVLNNERLGKMVSVRMGERLAMLEGSSSKRAAGQIFIDFEKQKDAPIIVQYEKVDDTWRIASCDLWPAPRAAGGADEHGHAH